MKSRKPSVADLDDCLKIEPGSLGAEIVGCEVALAIWRSLARSRSFNAVVLERPDHGDILGFGASVFVVPGFISRELKNPRPFLNARLFADIAAGNSPICPEGTLCGPDNEEVGVIVLACTSDERAFTFEKLREVQTQLAYHFVQSNIGYPIQGALVECVGRTQRNLHLSSGVWHKVSSFQDGQRTLAVLTRSGAFAASGSVAAALFRYTKPVLHLRDIDKELLAEACAGGTDHDFADRLSISPQAVKKRWQGVFERSMDNCPDLFPELNQVDKLSRGQQKRHHLVAYVRSHPQEIRPYGDRLTLPGPWVEQSP